MGLIKYLFALALSCLCAFAYGQSGSVSASPNPCLITSGNTCISTLTYQTSGAPGAGVLLRQTQQWAAYGSSGQYTATYINSPGYDFDLYAVYGDSGSQLLDSIRVYGVTASGTVSASPNPCSITSGSTCTSILAFQTTNAPGAGLLLRETQQWAAYGSSGQYTASYINSTGYHFDLYAVHGDTGSPLLDTTHVVGTVPGPAQGPLAVGAIRWDGWAAGADQRYQSNLASSVWSGRWPFFTITQPFSIRSDNQPTIDQEIDYASGAGLHYWAFLYYHMPQDGGYATGLNLYLASAKSSQIKFALILQGNDFGEASNWPATVETLVGYMARPNYQRVLNGQPLVFMHAPEHFMSRPGFGSAALGQLRTRYRDLYGKELYLVAMTLWGVDAPAYVNAGFSAAGSYTNLSSSEHVEKPYSDLTAANVSFWNTAAGAGLQVVPTVNAGWDPSPRWAAYNPGNPLGTWYTVASPAQIAAHLAYAIQWNRDNPRAPANAVLIYAWNEFDEGGWIAPTISEGDSRLQQIRQVLLGAPRTALDILATDRTYRGFLKRAPDEGGFAYWAGYIHNTRCSNPGALHSAFDYLTMNFYWAQEHQNLGLSNQDYVRAVYDAILRRPADPSGLAFYTGQLDTGAMTRDSLRQTFVGSSEFYSNTVTPALSLPCY